MNKRDTLFVVAALGFIVWRVTGQPREVERVPCAVPVGGVVDLEFAADASRPLRFPGLVSHLAASSADSAAHTGDYARSDYLA